MVSGTWMTGLVRTSLLFAAAGSRMSVPDELTAHRPFVYTQAEQAHRLRQTIIEADGNEATACPVELFALMGGYAS
jgi:hypothetical protein